VYSLSIIIPLYNEEKRIFKSLIKIRKFINQNKKKKIEIIFVSDGSYDQTNKIINFFIKKNKKICKFKFIRYQKNIGKGYAVKKGILKSKNSWILMCDADMSVDPNQFNKWFKNKEIINDKTAYFGSRSHKKSQIKASIIRIFLGIFFRLLIKILFNIKLMDTQCGFKVFHKKYAFKVFKKINSSRFAFDVELVIILKKNNIKIKELPLKWTHKSGSKLNILYDLPKMIYDIFLIKMSNKY
tara:strand:+ start:317 stop:1039 length:723 start_codon:yes stop_codon:yes gene_type:complete